VLIRRAYPKQWTKREHDVTFISYRICGIEFAGIVSLIEIPARGRFEPALRVCAKDATNQYKLTALPLLWCAPRREHNVQSDTFFTILVQRRCSVERENKGRAKEPLPKSTERKGED